MNNNHYTFKHYILFFVLLFYTAAFSQTTVAITDMKKPDGTSISSIDFGSNSTISFTVHVNVTCTTTPPPAGNLKIYVKRTSQANPEETDVMAVAFTPYYIGQTLVSWKFDHVFPMMLNASDFSNTGDVLYAQFEDFYGNDTNSTTKAIVKNGSGGSALTNYNICCDTTIKADQNYVITGQQPVGGSGIYAFRWKIFNNETNLFETAPGNWSGVNYTAGTYINGSNSYYPLEETSMYIRETSDVGIMTYTSNPITITVDRCPISNTITKTVSMPIYETVPNIRQASSSLFLQNRITTNRKALYHAGEYITINPGFEAEYGAIVEIYIEGCIPEDSEGRPAPENIDQKNFENKSFSTIENINEKMFGDETHTLNGFIVYPNPTNGKLTVTFESKVSSFSIIDITGKQLMTVNNNNPNEITLDLTGLAPGIYFLSADGMPIQKIIKN